MIHVGQPTLTGHERQYILDCLERVALTRGQYVDRFEAAFAQYTGVIHAIAVNNGTAALHLALVALGIGAGDEVLVPALTFVATANAVTYTGAKPVVCDVDRHTWNIDVSSARRACNGRTRAIIPVHLYGLPVNMDQVWALAEAFDLLVIEDAAEALGAEYQGSKTGTLGHVGCFSFYGNKTITTGEGGMITTNNDALAAKIRLLHGQAQAPGRRYWHETVGYNYRMTELQGALGLAQMEQLPKFLQRREEIAAMYAEWLPGLQYQAIPADCIHGNWSVCGLLPDGIDRDMVAGRLERDYGIETRPMFYPLTAMPMYRNGSLPVAERISKRGLCLPTHPGLRNCDVQFVCESMKEVLHGG